MKRIFLDTNVIIDFLEQREPFFKAAANVIDLGAKQKIILYTSSISFLNCIYVIRKAIGYAKAVESIKLLTQIIHVSPVTNTEFLSALNTESSDIEDITQYYSAKSAGCETIITRNAKHFPKDTISIVTPDEFLKQWIDNTTD
ncbi:MAG: PIN domain-containing protein [Bacteroidales bacterium]|jgi:predicted nucleic acid-binding protein|nr:PIN domain-containing protein [Bacteroidales bacterium]